ncbi:uncharacterized protein CLUP02_17489 [Colletotrichum lupini]|uniref:Uncharacterized protein n=1 Tax=Colletotrichum lupini TaxID=145971 RepID=A0A9Q8SEM5_9PEZI|nr:uncharacterized protein CLUP02_17489 [Colletotrichum lupini]UQC75979.1 hypothetical protein CLUP02_17489 [Colletotrichum lupini]
MLNNKTTRMKNRQNDYSLCYQSSYPPVTHSCIILLDGRSGITGYACFQEMGGAGQGSSIRVIYLLKYAGANTGKSVRVSLRPRPITILLYMWIEILIAPRSGTVEPGSNMLSDFSEPHYPFIHKMAKTTQNPQQTFPSSIFTLICVREKGGPLRGFDPPKISGPSAPRQPASQHTFCSSLRHRARLGKSFAVLDGGHPKHPRTQRTLADLWSAKGLAGWTGRSTTSRTLCNITNAHTYGLILILHSYNELTEASSLVQIAA